MVSVLSALRRARAFYSLARGFGDHLNRRVEVENVLLACAAGKRPMLTREECRALAFKLGVPSSLS